MQTKRNETLKGQRSNQPTIACRGRIEWKLSQQKPEKRIASIKKKIGGGQQNQQKGEKASFGEKKLKSGFLSFLSVSLTLKGSNK